MFQNIRAFIHPKIFVRGGPIILLILRVKKWSSIFWDITLCSPLKVSEISNEHVVSIFWVEE
jgi:hypothetical protein